MKALVIKKNFQFQLRTPSVRKWCWDKEIQKVSYPKVRFPCPASVSLEHALCRYSREEFEEVSLTSRSGSVVVYAATLPEIPQDGMNQGHTGRTNDDAVKPEIDRLRTELAALPERWDFVAR